MKKQTISFLMMAFFFLSGEAFAGNGTVISRQASDNFQHKQMKGDMSHMKMAKMNMKKDSVQSQNSVVRKGVINVEALDKNHDGKLYEDVMDWNVISDKPGVCPLCGMKLQEMTIQQVKQNLKKHGFKYK